MTPGNIQLKVIVNKALLARVTGQYLSSEHSSAWLLNKLGASQLPSLWEEGATLTGRAHRHPGYIRYLIM